MIDEELLEKLACPKCKSGVKLTQAGDGLLCEQCKLIYPIRNDIPIMMIEEAIPAEDQT